MGCGGISRGLKTEAAPQKARLFLTDAGTETVDQRRQARDLNLTTGTHMGTVILALWV